MTAEAGAGRGGKLDTLPAVGPLGELGLSRWGDGSPPPRWLCLLPHLSGVYHPWGSGSQVLGWRSSMEPLDFPS